MFSWFKRISAGEEALQDKPAERSISDVLNDLRPRINSMTLDEIIAETGRPRRGILAYLMRHKIKIKDYDGSLSQGEREERHRRISQFGDLNTQLVCPHCQTKGQVRSKSAEEITSTKVVPVIGNTIRSRKKITQMHCDNCGTTWNV